MKKYTFNNVRYTPYVSIIDEIRDLSNEGGIMPSERSLRAEETIPRIKLKLFDQQRLTLSPLLLLEESGIIHGKYPKIETKNLDISTLLPLSGPDLIAVEFHTNSLLLNLPVGSGKTLV